MVMLAGDWTLLLLDQLVLKLHDARLKLLYLTRHLSLDCFVPFDDLLDESHELLFLLLQSRLNDGCNSFLNKFGQLVLGNVDLLRSLSLQRPSLTCVSACTLSLINRLLDLLLRPVVIHGSRQAFVEQLGLLRLLPCDRLRSF